MRQVEEPGAWASPLSLSLSPLHALASTTPQQPNKLRNRAFHLRPHPFAMIAGRALDPSAPEVLREVDRAREEVRRVVAHERSAHLLESRFCFRRLSEAKLTNFDEVANVLQDICGV